MSDAVTGEAIASAPLPTPRTLARRRNVASSVTAEGDRFNFASLASTNGSMKLNAGAGGPATSPGTAGRGRIARKTATWPMYAAITAAST